MANTLVGILKDETRPLLGCPGISSEVRKIKLKLGEYAMALYCLSVLSICTVVYACKVFPFKSSTAVCVCVFIKLHITAQSGPVIVVILCHSH